VLNNLLDDRSSCSLAIGLIYNHEDAHVDEIYLESVLFNFVLYPRQIPLSDDSNHLVYYSIASSGDAFNARVSEKPLYPVITTRANSVQRTSDKCVLL